MSLARRLLLIALVTLLTGCASTRPVADRPESQPTGLPTTTPGDATVAPTATPAPMTRALATTPIPLSEDENGPVTPMMARLGLSGERHATLGDPAAPLTMVEFSDYG